MFCATSGGLLPGGPELVTLVFHLFLGVTRLAKYFCSGLPDQFVSRFSFSRRVGNKPYVLVDPRYSANLLNLWVSGNVRHRTGNNRQHCNAKSALDKEHLQRSVFNLHACDWFYVPLDKVPVTLAPESAVIGWQD